MSSKRELIKANLVAALKTVASVGDVSTKIERFDAVDSSRMPFVMVLSADEDRELASSQRDTDCEWTLHVWAYLSAEHDCEVWVERLRAKIMADRSRGTTSGTPNALDCFITKIITDSEGVLAPSSFILMHVRVAYRVRE